MSEPLLKLRHIRKTFGATVALGDVDLDVYPGEIRGLIGENGSGKSTISSIAAGMQRADSGEMSFEGKPWAPKSMVNALEHGVGMIVQESGTIAGISVAENLFLGETRRFARGPLGLVSRRSMIEAANQVLEDFGIKGVEGSQPMGELDFQTRKLVEIAKVAMKAPRVFVVDETTTALSQEGRDLLYAYMRRSRDEGRGVVFISHDLDEIMEVCDTLTVLRDGSIIRSFERAEFEASAIRRAMIGRDLEGDYYRAEAAPTALAEVAIRAQGVSLPGGLHDVSLEVHRGEIVGIGGLSSCGMHDLGKVLFGAVRPSSGAACLGTGEKIASEVDAMSKGIAYVAKDRDTESLALSSSIQDNLAIAGLDIFAKSAVVSPKAEREYVDGLIDALSIKCSSPDQPVSDLSGGNKQKVVFGKWIGRHPDVLILDCPTRGVDVGVKQAMYQLMCELKADGKAILMISEELQELIGMSDRVLIMKDGHVAGEFDRSPELTDAVLIDYMI